MIFDNLVIGIYYNYEDCSWEFHFNGNVISTNFITRKDCLSFAIIYVTERYFPEYGKGVALLDNGNTTPSHG